MAMLNCSYDRLLVKVLYGVYVLVVCLPFCLSAVENCPPCGPGEYCSKFFGVCLACKDYCPGDADCPSACPPIEPNFTTIASTTTGPTSIQSDTTYLASAVVVLQPTNANTPSDGGDITFLDNGKDASELPAWLSVGLLITLGIIVLIIFVCRKYLTKLKMPRICRFSSGDSENIELDERPQSDGGRIKETEWTVQTDPLANQPPGCHQTTGEYTAVPVDDVDSHVNDVIINLPGPSQQNSSAVPPDPTHSTSVSRKTPGHPFQSASIRLTENPQREFETPQGACPSDRLSCPRTPEILRKQTDGTHEGHEISIGTSSFNPPNGTCEDNHSAHGD